MKPLIQDCHPAEADESVRADHSTTSGDKLTHLSVRSAYVESLGCAANRADAQAVERLIAGAGWRQVNAPEGARIAVVLTCGFTAQQEAANRRRLEELQQALPEGGRLFVGGCLPAITQTRLPVPETAFVFGPASMASFERELKRLAFDQPLAVASGGSCQPRLVRVSTGCSSRCSFCAIPRAAGWTRSRPIAEVLEELAELEREGVQAVQLTSEDVSAYGREMGLSFVDLVGEVLARTGLRKVTLDTLNPKWLYSQIDGVLDLLSDGRFDNRLYVPIQSGSDEVLRRMARGYVVSQVEEILAGLSAHRRGVQFSTDFIVGFPGEGDEDFEATRALRRRHQFDFVEVFTYTERSGTPAIDFRDTVPQGVRLYRAKMLVADELELQLERNGVGGRVDLLAFAQRRERLPVNTNLEI